MAKKSDPKTKTKLLPKDYKSHVKPTWCPGCGDFGVLASLYQALAQLELDPSNTVVVSGIGCSSRLPSLSRHMAFKQPTVAFYQWPSVSRSPTQT